MPESYPKALFLLQGSAITLYAIVASVVYYFVGSAVPAPALGAASHVAKKIAWGLAIPTIVVAGVINGHVALKYIYVVLKGEMITEKSKRASAWWVALCAVLWIFGWVLAETIPNFSQLLGLVGALMGSWFTCECSPILPYFATGRH